MKPLQELMGELESLIPEYKTENTSISSEPVGWHIAHSFMVLDRMSKTVTQSDPTQYKKPSFSLKKLVVMYLGRIPRGRGKAPAAVVPTEVVTIEIINDRITAVKKALPEMEMANENGFMNHPVFGILNKKETLRFMQIHTQHHIEIIKDIIRKKA